MKRTIVITGGDENFFPLLRDLIGSLEAVGAREHVDLGCLDVGLEPASRTWIEARVDRVVEPGWDLEIPDGAAVEPHQRALTARPFLPRHFPGYETLMWIDGDVWVQQWDGIDLFVRAASDGSLAIATHRHHAYVHATPGVTQWHLSRLKAMFGEAMMNKWMFRPSYNAGVFAMHANASHWSVWADYFQKGLVRSGGRPMGDQVPLSVALFETGLPVHPLPSTCNWLCHLAVPAWDGETRRYCEPTLPHHPLHLIHLTADTADRPLKVRVLGGSTRSVHVRFSSPRP